MFSNLHASSWSTVGQPKEKGLFDFEAATIALLIDSLDIFLLVTNLKSINETFGVGTLIAVPSNLPLRLGNTKLIALAAPVEVGIIASPDALALLKSL